MNETASLHLPQFAASDRIHHDDFNAAFAAIDTAVAANSTAITALESAKAGTADLSAEATARQNAVSAEATARQNADSAEATARQNADTAEATARQNADTALGGRIDAEAATRAAAISAVTAAMGTQGHTCRVIWGTYTGNGRYGTDNPNTLTFPFTPQFIILANNARERDTNRPVLLLQGLSTCCGTDPDHVLNVSWNEKTVSWYNSTSAEWQSNSGTVYHYLAVGSDDA